MKKRDPINQAKFNDSRRFTHLAAYNFVRPQAAGLKRNLSIFRRIAIEK
jgi:hypothetical protein